jgi:hypothetical protein
MFRFTGVDLKFILYHPIAYVFETNIYRLVAGEDWPVGLTGQMPGGPLACKAVLGPFKLALFKCHLHKWLEAPNHKHEKQEARFNHFSRPTKGPCDLFCLVFFFYIYTKRY